MGRYGKTVTPMPTEGIWHRCDTGRRVVATPCGREMKGMTTMGGDAMDGSDSEHLRPARMRIKTTVLMSHGDESHPTDLIDISATGVLLRRPPNWNGKAGESWVLDMIFGHDLHIHLEAKVARLSDRHIGFAYTMIPEDKQVPLWNLLGGYADILEMWHDEEPPHK